MKRSEMVKLMGEFIAFEYDENIIKANTVCKALLYFMEEAGMLPPFRPDEHPLGYGAAWLSDDEVTENYFKFKHTWEPEND